MDDITNNQKKYILDQYKKNLVLNGIILFIFIWVYFIFISWELSAIKSQKDVLRTEITSFKNMETKWLTYQEVLAKIPAEQSDLKQLFEQSWPQVFKQTFENTTWEKYLDFLSKKEAEILEFSNDNSIAQRDRKLSIALPFYWEWVESVISGTGESQKSQEVRLTDLGYINYVERLMRSFGLVTNSPISLWNAVLVDEQVLNDTESSLSSQIFYLPLTLDIEGRKSDVVDFLHFIQHVWNISIVNKGDNFQDIEFHKDDIVKKRISWSSNTQPYNIYENMIANVQNISFQNFIDASTSQTALRSESSRTTNWFVNFIKTSSNANQAFKVQVDLRFYVRGLPAYKKDSYVLSLVDDFEKVTKEVNESLSQAQNRNLLKLNTEMIEVVNSLQSLSIYTKNNQPKFNNFRQAVMKKENTDAVFKNAYKAEQELRLIKQLLDKNQQILTKTTNIK